MNDSQQYAHSFPRSSSFNDYSMGYRDCLRPVDDDISFRELYRDGGLRSMDRREGR